MIESYTEGQLGKLQCCGGADLVSAFLEMSEFAATGRVRDVTFVRTRIITADNAAYNNNNNNNNLFLLQKRTHSFTNYKDNEKKEKNGKETQNKAKAYILLGYLITRIMFMTNKENAYNGKTITTIKTKVITNLYYHLQIL